MILATHSEVPFQVILMDFEELKKKGEGLTTTQAFLVAIDECPRFMAAKLSKECTSCIISLLERDLFTNTKVVVTDNGPAFGSHKWRAQASTKRTQLRFSTSYNLQANDLAEQVIRDLKKYIFLCPSFRGGWKCALEAGANHHNQLHATTLGYTPYFIVHESPWLPADHELNHTNQITPHESQTTKAMAKIQGNDEE